MTKIKLLRNKNGLFCVFFVALKVRCTEIERTSGNSDEDFVLRISTQKMEAL